MTEPLHWNDWTTLHLVQLGYEADAAPRVVRLAHPSASVGDAVRVVIAGIEIEGRISAIEGATLRVALAAVRSRKTPMAKASLPAKGRAQRGTRRAR